MMWKSQPVCILTSGHTVDGREVSPKVVEELAETYDPKKYNARINIEHNQYGFKLGSVLSLTTQDDGDNKKLFAELKPNDYLLSLIQQGQKLHTSCEIVMNFAKTGKAYLTGLALTDTPASLGTTELQLSVNGDQAQTFSTSEAIEGKKPALLSNPFKKEDDIMDKAVLELLNQVQTTQEATNSALTALTEKVDAFSTEKLPEPLPPVANNNEGDKPEKNEELSALKTQVTELSSNLEKTESALQTLTEKLSQADDEQQRLEATGGSSSDKEEIL